MFEIHRVSNNEIRLVGHFDASQEAAATKVFESIIESCTVNCADLDYISSAGLGVLLSTQRTLSDENAALKLTDMKPFVKSIFVIAGFDQIFEID